MEIIVPLFSLMDLVFSISSELVVDHLVHLCVGLKRHQWNKKTTLNRDADLPHLPLNPKSVFRFTIMLPIYKFKGRKHDKTIKDKLFALPLISETKPWTGYYNNSVKKNNKTKSGCRIRIRIWITTKS